MTVLFLVAVELAVPGFGMFEAMEMEIVFTFLFGFCYPGLAPPLLLLTVEVLNREFMFLISWVLFIVAGWLLNAPEIPFL